MFDTAWFTHHSHKYDFQKLTNLDVARSNKYADGRL